MHTLKEKISGVYIAIIKVQIADENYKWQTIKTCQIPETINLLQLTSSALYQEIKPLLEEHSQIRFLLPFPSTEAISNCPPHHPGSYIEFEDGKTEPLFVPAAEEMGVKIISAYPICDFSLKLFCPSTSIIRSKIWKRYILKPTIELNAEQHSTISLNN